MTELDTVRDIFSSGGKHYQPDVQRKREHVYLETLWVNYWSRFIQGDLLCGSTGSDKLLWVRKVEYCVVSVTGFAYHAICQILMLAA